MQVDKRAVPLPEDFELTTNSICNLSIQLKPYSMNEDSVSIRLHGVQVVELKERVEHNPFKPVEGADDNQASHFNNLEAQSAVSSKVDHPFGEEYEAPAQPPKNDLDDEIPF